jgi:hypothetical protein
MMDLMNQSSTRPDEAARAGWLHSMAGKTHHEVAPFAVPTPSRPA